MSTDEIVPTSAGLSSFNLLDEQRLFAGLSLYPGMTILDFGCGVGNYSIAASSYIGHSGRICAVDPWKEGIETLEVRAEMAGLKNIRALCSEAGSPLPLLDRTVDLCLMATVAHILVQEQVMEETLTEVNRVLKPDGKVAVVEFHKKEGPPGPPLSWRLAPEEVQAIFLNAGFVGTHAVEVGPHNYLLLLRSSPL